MRRVEEQERTTAEGRRALLKRLLEQRAEQPSAQVEHPFRSWVNPPLARLMATVGLDRRFVRGEGVYLWDEEGRRYTDLIAMYGALPFGHNPAVVWDALERLHASGEPLFAQPSLVDAAGELAAKLVALAPEGLDRVTFTNSGAESVEAAIKLARAHTGRPGVLSTVGGFHGKTVAALSATHRAKLQAPFGLPLAGFEAVPFGDADALARYLNRNGPRTAAFIVEPIQGEGGMNVAPPGYLTKALEACRRHGVLLVVDEVQTGLGRTGSMFACADEGITPDLLLLAKALGGGVVPIGAILSRSAITPDEFALRHSSTFGGNALACRAALATLERLEEGDLLASVRANGEWLRSELDALRRRYPTILTDVRGRGYMIGIEFTDRMDAFGRWGVFADAAEKEELAVLVCAYLFGVHAIRLMSTLSGARVLRVEPPLTTTQDELRPLIGALRRALEHLEAGDVGGLIAHIGGDRQALPVVRISTPAPPTDSPTGDADEGRWAAIIHARTEADHGSYDNTLGRLEPTTLDRALARFRAEDDVSVVTGSVRVCSSSGARSYGELISLPITALELAALPAERAIRCVGAAVARARDRGARVVGLGAFTSIVTGNGVYVADLGVPITTGNALTAVMSAQGLEAAVAARGLDMADLEIGVVGATGSIGQAVALLLSASAHSLCLVGNPDRPTGSLAALREMAGDLLRRLDGLAGQGQAGAPGSLAADALALPVERRLGALLESGRITLTVDASALRACPAVAAATSSAHAFIRPEHLHENAIVIDTSEPSNVHADVARLRGDVLVERGGLVTLPGDADLGPGLGLPRGQAYACISEAILLGLEHTDRHGSLGARLDAELLFQMRDLAQRHGFQRAAAVRDFQS